MIDLNTTNEWQHRDDTGMILPWYTKSFLDELVTWDLRDKKVCEYGGGASTIWWNKKAKHVFTVDNDEGIFEALVKHISRDSVMMYAPVENKDQYVNWAYGPHGGAFDTIIIDGDPVEWRDDCVRSAIANLKPGGRLIIDNWDQPSVWVPSAETRKLLADWPVKIYPQEGHEDWKTALFIKP